MYSEGSIFQWPKLNRLQDWTSRHQPVRLRLCLGSQEGPLDQQAVSSTKNKQGKAQPFLRPELVAELLDPSAVPTAEQRYGLEQLLRKQQQIREEQYHAFRKHWYRLQEQDFRRSILAALDKEAVAA